VPVSLISTSLWSEILSRRRRRETSWSRRPGVPSARMSTMVTGVEVSVASTSRCRKCRLPESLRALSRAILAAGAGDGWTVDGGGGLSGRAAEAGRACLLGFWRAPTRQMLRWPTGSGPLIRKHWYFAFLDKQAQSPQEIQPTDAYRAHSKNRFFFSTRTIAANGVATGHWPPRGLSGIAAPLCPPAQPPAGAELELELSKCTTYYSANFLISVQLF
jgi:hypothetical protein